MVAESVTVPFAPRALDVTAAHEVSQFIKWMKRERPQITNDRVPTPLFFQHESEVVFGGRNNATVDTEEVVVVDVRNDFIAPGAQESEKEPTLVVWEFRGARSTGDVGKVPGRCYFFGLASERFLYGAEFGAGESYEVPSLTAKAVIDGLAAGDAPRLQRCLRITTGKNAQLIGGPPEIVPSFQK